MTTDTHPKRAAVVNADGWTIGGIAKGAGMIAPDMATMLAFITTDVVADARLLQGILSEVVSHTFNAITIDGDTSTNDTVLAFANGASGVTPDVEQFSSALLAVCRSLAEQIVADGEGATKFVRVRVTGAAYEEDARRAARTVAESLLVKTALYGGDPNWGRIAAALGYSHVEGSLDRMTISIGGYELFSSGEPVASDAHAQARVALKDASQVTILCDLGAGDAFAEVLTTDLSPSYVSLNAKYET
jgi:glutamate N-acetyltransferase/amino-acid N-acetyltransferase